MHIFFTILAFAYLFLTSKSLKPGLKGLNAPLGPITLEMLAITMSIAAPFILLAMGVGLIFDTIFSRNSKPKA